MNTRLENNTHLKQNKFKVPEGYFDAVQSDILNKIHESNQPAPKSKLRKLHFGYSIAASILLLLAGSWFFLNNNYKTEEESFAAVLEQNIYDYDLELLESYAMIGRESELADEEDLDLINSKFDDIEMIEENGL